MMISNLVIDLVLLILGASAAALIALYIYFQKKFKYWDERNVPHAKPSFPFGNLNGKESLAVVFRKLYEESRHERYYGLWQLHRPSILINDPDLIKQVLVGDFMSFHDRGVYSNEKDDPLSANLVSLEGSSWRNLRVKLTPTFTSGKMKMMFPIILKCGKEMEEVVEGLADMGDVFEARDLTARFATDAIASCAFGIEANSLKNPDSIVRKMGKKFFEPNWITLIRNIIAFLTPDLGKLMKITVNPKDASDFFLKLFHDTMDYREKNEVKRNDVMHLLIQLKNKGYIDDVDAYNKQDGLSKSEKFTFEQAAAQAFIYLIGGFETSSTTMQFTLYELALNHKIQAKVREEIKQVLAKHNGELTYEAVMTEMEYLGRVVDETLRKYPPGFILARICTKDYKVPDSDLTIEKGTGVVIPVFGVHNDDRYYPDPKKYDPDRFTAEQKASRHNYTYLPFGEGPRVCIGQRFGMMQTKVGLISLLSKYKFDIIPGRTPIPVEFDPKSIQIAPKGGMHLRISKAD